jgi:hypothetical protein
MSTPIEMFLYGSGGTHAVVEIVLAADKLVLSVAPWTSLPDVKVAEFTEAKIASIDVYADSPDDLNLPWDIIGFDSHRLSESHWKFVLHCAGVEYVFEARWPQLRTP